jgi:hypothetical protein
MRAIKGLVIFMGVLLISGVALMGYGIFHQKGSHKVAFTAPAVPQFDTIQVPLPAGGRIEQMVVAGDRVVLRVQAAGAERLMVLDPTQGRMVGSFVLAPEPALR